MSDQSGKRRLGRGLEALLGPGDTAVRDETAREIDINAIAPNPFQPRRSFGAEELSELAESLRTSGLLQPILVRPAANGGYELIAGERRMRAAQQIGWSAIPALIRDADDTTLLTLALVENLQRDSLSPVEEAQGYQRLLGEFGLSQQQVADAVGRDRSTVANAVRLLRLPDTVLTMVHERKLSVGHARALLAVEDEQIVHELARSAVTNGWSVREMEARVKPGRPKARRGRMKGHQDAAVGAEQRRIEDALRRRLQTDVRLVLHGTKGRIEIAFYSNDDLARLIDLVLGTPFA